MGSVPRQPCNFKKINFQPSWMNVRCSSLRFTTTEYEERTDPLYLTYISIFMKIKIPISRRLPLQLFFRTPESIARSIPWSAPVNAVIKSYHVNHSTLRQVYYQQPHSWFLSEELALRLAATDASYWALHVIVSGCFRVEMEAAMIRILPWRIYLFIASRNRLLYSY